LKILSCTDFSSSAQEACTVAATIAAKTSAALILAYVGQSPTHLNLVSTTEVTDAIRIALKSEAARLRLIGAEVEEELSEGFPTEEILNIYRRHNADWIVLGWNPLRTPTERRILGNVAEYVAEHARVPTLIIRNTPDFHRWIEGTDNLRILVGEDLSSPSDSLLLWVKSLTEIGPCNTTVAYIARPDPESFDDKMHPSPVPQNVSAEILRELKTRTSQLHGDSAVETVVVPSWGAAEAPLADLVNELQSGLLVVGSHQRHGIDRFMVHSISRALIRNTTVNLAIVPGVSLHAME
jgi:nucleotide-binding universal stress UspA family protein